MNLKLIVSLIFTCYLSSFSQQKGRIFYSVKKINIDTTLLKKDTPSQKKIYNEVMSTFERIKTIKLELKFNGSKSYFHSVDELNNDNDNSMQLTTAKLITKTNSEFFFLNDKKELIEKKESFGENFQIVKTINIKSWKMIDKTKKIGKYTCYLAEKNTTIKTVNGNKTVKQIVWYAPEVSLPYGPKQFVGFPGLVLEAIDGNIQYKVTKIMLNPKEEIEIKKIAGKTITEKEYKKIIEKSVNNTNSFYR